MTCTVDMQDVTPLGGGTLKNGKPYALVLLKPASVHAAIALHQATIDAFPPEEKSFMLAKSDRYFSGHVNKADGNAILGIVCDSQLIAQAVITHPAKDWRDTGMVDMKPVAPAHQTSVLQAVCVDRAYRGQMLMQHLIGQWLLHAAQYGRTHLLAEIDVRNAGSWDNFLKGGLNIHSIGIDPADSTLLYNAYATVTEAAQKKILPLFNSAARPSLFACGVADIEQQQTLFKNGYRAIFHHKQQSTLIFCKPEKTAPGKQAGCPRPWQYIGFGQR